MCSLYITLFLFSFLLLNCCNRERVQATIECQFAKLEKMVVENRTKETRAHSELDCLLSSCSCTSPCIASFHEETGVCRWLPTPSLKIPIPFDILQRYLSFVPDKSWSSFISRATLTNSTLWDQPSGLWLMDSVFRGYNLGSKGRRLDCSDKGVVWNDVGPRGSMSGMKFTRLSKASRPVIQNLHDGQYLLNPQ